MKFIHALHEDDVPFYFANNKGEKLTEEIAFYKNNDESYGISSLEIISPNVALKTLDKSTFFAGGLAIPKKSYKYFGIENLQLNQRKPTTIIYRNKKFEAYFTAQKSYKALQYYNDFMVEIRNKYPYAAKKLREYRGKIDNGPKMEITINLEKNELNIDFIGDDIMNDYIPFSSEDFLKLFSDIKKFVAQSHSHDLTTKSYIEYFGEFQVTKSFGQGTPAKVSWLSLSVSSEQQKRYFVSFYYDKFGKLFLVLGIKEDIQEKYDWPSDIQKIYPRFSDINVSDAIANRYPKSRIFKEFSVDIKNIDTSLEALKEDIEQSLSNALQLLFQVINSSEKPKIIWRLSPGKKGIYWEEWRNANICSLNIPEYKPYFNELDQITDRDSFKTRLKELARIVHPENSNFDLSISHQNTIWSYFHEMKIGDTIIASTGKSRIYGIGTIKSNVLFQDSEDCPVIREVHWEYDDLNIPIPSEVSGNFLSALNKLSLDDYSKIITSIESGFSTNLDSIIQLLERKGQIILYGPPGTGKTYSVQSLIKKTASTPYISTTKDYGNIQFFWLITYKDKYDDISTINSKSIYTYQWKSNYNYSKYFYMINEGDYFAIYLWDENKIIGYAKCIKKDEESFQYQFITLLDGPKYGILKSDPEFSKGKIIRTKGNARITILENEEFERLIFLSGIKYEELGIKITGNEIIQYPSEFITFHQSFSYEEFIEGLRPITDADGRISYSVKEGIFKDLCRTAYNTLLTLANIDKRWNEDQDVPHLTDEETQYALSLAPKVPFYLVIDEINRGDISRIFGELITLLEKDKRLLAPHEITTKLPSSRTRFGIPPNLFLIGTMNTADKSIALIDIALRRRFGFIEMMPDYDLLYRTLSSDDESLLEVYSIAIALLRTINQRILEEHDREHQIGHSFLLKLKDARTRDQAISELSMIWYHEIIPLLHEYFYDAPRKLFKVIGPEFMKSDPKCIYFYPEKEGESFLSACKSISKGYDLNGLSSTDAL